MLHSMNSANGKKNFQHQFCLAFPYTYVWCMGAVHLLVQKCANVISGQSSNPWSLKACKTISSSIINAVHDFDPTLLARWDVNSSTCYVDTDKCNLYKRAKQTELLGLIFDSEAHTQETSISCYFKPFWTELHLYTVWYNCIKLHCIKYPLLYNDKGIHTLSSIISNKYLPIIILSRLSWFRGQFYRPLASALAIGVTVALLYPVLAWDGFSCICASKISGADSSPIVNFPWGKFPLVAPAVLLDIMIAILALWHSVCRHKR